ncbi:hypothetical protein DM860_010035 [Cuscuta australis]|uniref:Uncharacterized protein n=1 Tax=Cuscuta australis TaxID=267555 RepID=A0A328DA96_9ASTE|nr:hypothetical protein DM860_010035 [Cuscuta australis]
MKMMVRRRGESSFLSRAKKRRLSDGVAYSIFVATDEDEMVSAEEDDIFENEEEEDEDFPVEEEGNMDEDDDEDEEDDEEEDEEREDSAKVFLVGDDVWESKAFSKWREANWALFSYDIPEGDFYIVSAAYFKPLEDPRCERGSHRRSDELKMGHTFWHITNLNVFSRTHISDDAFCGARLAIEFFNSEKQDGENFEV